MAGEAHVIQSRIVPIGTVVSLVQFRYSNTIRSLPVLYNSLRNRLSRIVYSVRIGPPQPKFLCFQPHPQNLQPNGPFLMPRTAAPAARQNYGTTAETLARSPWGLRVPPSGGVCPCANPQNKNFRATCEMRGDAALTTLPNVASLMFPSTEPLPSNWVWLKVLNVSKRNSRDLLSVNFVTL